MTNPACRIFTSAPALALILSLLAGCGGRGGASGAGSLAITITGAASFNPNIDQGRIAAYRVSVAGADIAAPVAAEFPGDATEGVVDGVPAGDDRTVSVEALNANRVTIRAGDAGHVSVGGGVTDVGVQMEAVPIFANIADGATIENTRLVFKLFSDPAHPVAVEERDDQAQATLADASTNSMEIHLDQSTGLGRMSPPLMAVGAHRFAVVDLVTGHESEVNVQLTDGAARRPAPTVSAALAAGGARACSAPLCSAGR